MFIMQVCFNFFAILYFEKLMKYALADEPSHT
jgi:hypothetical protein